MFHHKRWLAGASAVLVAVAGLGTIVGFGAVRPSSASSFTSLCGSMTNPPATFKHVMVIMEENRSENTVIGNPATLGDPYINNTLVPACGLATNYHNWGHPSVPNYLALTSGTAEGVAINHDCTVPTNCPQAQASIFDQIDSASMTWRGYDESMPSNCDLSPSGSYLNRHNPAIYYSSIRAQCKSWDVPLGTTASGALKTALSPTKDGLPNYSFVTPNACNDMHSCSTASGDKWLSKWIPIIEKSAAYQSGQLVVFVTWDEGHASDDTAGETCYDAAHADTSLYPSCWVGTIVMSPYTTPRTNVGTYFNHLGLLATTEHLLGLPQLPTVSGQTTLTNSFGL